MILKRIFLSSILLGLVVANAQACAEPKSASGAPGAQNKQEQSLINKENWWKWALGAGALFAAAYYCSKSVDASLAYNPLSWEKKIRLKGDGDIVARRDGYGAKSSVVVSTANARNGLTWTYTQGGGVASAIGKAAGGELLKDKKIAGKSLKVGQAITTPGYGLTKNGYNHIVHVAGPDCRNPQESQNRQKLLQEAYDNVFIEASRVGAQQVVLPSISTGSFKYPDNYEAAFIATACARKALQKSKTLHDVVFVLDNSMLSFFQRAVEKVARGHAFIFGEKDSGFYPV